MSHATFILDAFVHLFGPVQGVRRGLALRARRRERRRRLGAHPFRERRDRVLERHRGHSALPRFTVFGTQARVALHKETHPDTPRPTTLTLRRTGAPAELRTCEKTDTVRANPERSTEPAAAGADHPFPDAEKIGSVALSGAICASAASGRPATVA